jgi:phosphoglycerate dehydrogenase-like enzyme
VCGEPAPQLGSALLQHLHKRKNLIITPHLGGCTTESMEKTEFYLAQKLSTLWSSWMAQLRGNPARTAAVFPG